ncbi:MAG: CDP-diacylglycerol--glycerol-3-phosphate 3-phosphatidyltransferase [Lachnospiraceae bacterium]|nr:CDP-diacylglycerol--glycerol-3-phosphate 3-phosphatidyltransferase [Lachnospiraceae bacterium]
MNLPNRITMFRVLLIPVFVVLLMLENILPYYNFIALAVFAAACFSDFLDGHIARKYNLVTTFGKFMDPLADKILVSTALILLIEFEKIPAVVVAVILAREFIISGFRLIACDKGVVLAAGYLGKIKTFAQMFMCCFMLFTADRAYNKYLFFRIVDVVGQIFMWFALVMTVVSLVDYIWNNVDVLRDKKTDKVEVKKETKEAKAEEVAEKDAK